MLNTNVLTNKGTQRLIFTDLDGTLLDHNTYRHDAATVLLDKLNQIGIPVIPISSKTFAEILPLREKINNQHPFITENGAGIYIPKGYFENYDGNNNHSTAQDFLTISASRPRATWLKMLTEQASDFTTEYQTFHALNKLEGPEAISRVSGLSIDQSVLANQREFSETVVWLSTDSRKKAFIKVMSAAGAKVHQGGRFLSITDQIDKGAALKCLTSIYAQQSNIKSCETLAIGDGNNDISMLEVADSALIIRSPHHRPPVLKRTEKVSTSLKNGPEGWVAGVTRWLQTF